MFRKSIAKLKELSSIEKKKQKQKTNTLKMFTMFPNMQLFKPCIVMSNCDSALYSIQIHVVKLVLKANLTRAYENFVHLDYFMILL